MAFYWIQSAYNLSDMLSKHWDHPSVYHAAKIMAFYWIQSAYNLSDMLSKHGITLVYTQ